MSAAARARIAAAKKAWWAKQQGKPGPKEGYACHQEIDGSETHESGHAEEIVGDDEGAVGGEEKGNVEDRTANLGEIVALPTAIVHGEPASRTPALLELLEFNCSNV